MDTTEAKTPARSTPPEDVSRPGFTIGRPRPDAE